MCAQSNKTDAGRKGANEWGGGLKLEDTNMVRQKYTYVELHFRPRPAALM